MMFLFYISFPLAISVRFFLSLQRRHEPAAHAALLYLYPQRCLLATQTKEKIEEETSPLCSHIHKPSSNPWNGTTLKSLKKNLNRVSHEHLLSSLNEIDQTRTVYEKEIQEAIVKQLFDRYESGQFTVSHLNNSVTWVLHRYERYGERILEATRNLKKNNLERYAEVTDVCNKVQYLKSSEFCTIWAKNVSSQSGSLLEIHVDHRPIFARAP